MSALVSLYFQLHQPYRLRPYRFREIGRSERFFHDDLNREIFLRVAERCYWPTGIFFEKLASRLGDRFAMSFSFSGTWIEQCAEFEPDLLALYRAIGAMSNVEVLSETSAHSLVSFFDLDEFALQVAEHSARIVDFCGKRPRVFRNTELAYSNEVGRIVSDAGFEGCMVEGWERLLDSDFNASRMFHHPAAENFKLLPRNYRLSDDIAFRFSNRHWHEWPLDSAKYFSWMERSLRTGSEFLGLYMDYETLGEHQSLDTGILDFMGGWIESVSQSSQFHFVTPCDSVRASLKSSPLDVPTPLSWADTERDLSAWMGNAWQLEAMNAAMALKNDVYERDDKDLLKIWRRLLCSDHFYYMSTKCASDGEVHGYFSPYASPQDAYIEYRNVLSGFELLMKGGKHG